MKSNRFLKKGYTDWELCRGGGKSGGYDCVK